MRFKPVPALIFLLLVLLTMMCQESAKNPAANGNPPDPIYTDPTYPVEERVNDLLSRMTLEEKIGQMTQAGRQALGSEADIKTYIQEVGGSVMVSYSSWNGQKIHGNQCGGWGISSVSLAVLLASKRGE